MRMRLTEFPKVRYTMMEYHLFDMLPKNGKPINSNALADARKELGAWKAKHPLNVITVTMSRLINKVKINREEFRIQKDGKRKGHPEVEYWLESKANGK
jgi:hypothetical protein